MLKADILERLNNRFESEKILAISNEELNAFLKSSQIIYEQDTRLRDFIRIVQNGDSYFLQETSNKQEIILRKFDKISDAMKLVKERLEIYDKMWDGCGCKINYYE
jgi:hypothetical protein